MRLPLRNMAGETVGEVELLDAVFAAPVNQAVMHQALMRQMANRRLGTHDVKSRAEVKGGGKKPWRQKGTGRARQGSTRAPHWRHGGVAFGPTPRSYEQKMPLKMRRLALRSALTVKANEQQIIVLDDLNLDMPKTKAFKGILNALSVDRSALILLAEANDNVELSARNLVDVKTLRASYLNMKDLLGYDTLVMPQSALNVVQTILAGDAKPSPVTPATGQLLALPAPEQLLALPATDEAATIPASGGFDQMIIAPTSSAADDETPATPATGEEA